MNGISTFRIYFPIDTYAHYSYAHPLTNASARSLTPSHTHTHTHSNTYTLNKTHTLNNTRTLNNTYTHAHSCSNISTWEPNASRLSPP